MPHQTASASNAENDEGDQDQLSVEEDETGSSSSSEVSGEFSDLEESEDDDEKEELDGTQSFEDREIEQGIEGDFERLLADVRNADTSVSAGVLSQEWDFQMRVEEEEDADWGRHDLHKRHHLQFQDDIRAASGIGRIRKKKSRRQGPPLSLQVRALIGEGNQAYVDNDLPTAISTMQEVLRIEPRAISAWSVLAQCYDDMDQHDRALQLRIMAAHLRHDSEEWEKLAKESKELGHAQQAIYCYGKVVRLDPSNIGAFWERANLAKSLGDLKTAKHGFLGILQRFPHDLVVLNELQTILVERNELEECAQLYQAAFEHYLAQSSTPTSTNAVNINSTTPASSFGPMELLVLADLHNTTGEYLRAIDVIKRGTRWFQGRASQTYWNDVVDDREYDLPGYAGSPDGGAGVLREGNPRPGKYTLETNARHRLAVARIKLLDLREAKLHADAVLSQDPLDYGPLFHELADAWFSVDQFAEALPIYETLGSEPATNSIYVLMQTAVCLRMQDEIKEAAEVYEHILQADSDNNEAKMKLAELYEIMNIPKRALDLVYEVIESRKHRRDNDEGVDDGSPSRPTSTRVAQPAGSLFPEASQANNARNKQVAPPKKMSRAQVAELEAQKEAEVLRGWKRLNELWTAVRDGRRRHPNVQPHQNMIRETQRREWMVEAGRMADTFRETRLLFTSGKPVFRGMFPRSKNNNTNKQAILTDADEDRIASRLQLDLGNSEKTSRTRVDGETRIYRRVHFQDWLKMFIQYALLLTEYEQQGEADEMLRHVMTSVAFLSIADKVRIRLTLLTCAIRASKYAQVIEHARWLILNHQFNNEPLRILLASLSSGLKQTDSFITSPFQKFLFREMRIAATAATIEHSEGQSVSDHFKRNGRRWVLKGYFGSGGREKRPEKGKGKQLPVGGEEEDDDDEGEDDEEGAEAGGEISPALTGSDAPARLPTKKNPVYFAIYGQMCLAAKSYQSAIFYLLQAYDLCQQDPMICLSLAVASLGRAMQRQSDNRHHLVVQGFAFFTQYKKYRTMRNDRLGHDYATSLAGEAEYNMGRMFHQLGLLSHAEKHYKRVLEMQHPSGHSSGSLDFKKEAAYNLALIYTMTGAQRQAQGLYRTYLSI